MHRDQQAFLPHAQLVLVELQVVWASCFAFSSLSHEHVCRFVYVSAYACNGEPSKKSFPYKIFNVLC